LRRKFLDRVISLTDREYLKKLIDYRNILRERNELLKDYQRKAFFDYDVLMEAIDERLVDCAIYIYTARRNFLREFRGIVRKEMEELSGRVRIYDMRLDREGCSEEETSGKFSKRCCYCEDDLGSSSRKAKHHF